MIDDKGKTIEYCAICHSHGTCVEYPTGVAHQMINNKTELTKLKKEFANNLVSLWIDYKKSREAREELNIPSGLPVFNAVNFMYWLENKYKQDEN